MCPTQLILEKTTPDKSKDSFLDLDIVLEDGQFKVSTYNKTVNFDFPVICFPYLDSNISFQLIYNCFYLVELLDVE